MSIAFGSVLAPLEDALHGLLFGIQHLTGLPWAWSIIALTVVVRLAILPLAIVQMRSMRGMQKIAPELQKLKQKHKGDNQKLQAEMMVLYRELTRRRRGQPDVDDVRADRLQGRNRGPVEHRTRHPAVAADNNRARVFLECPRAKRGSVAGYDLGGEGLSDATANPRNADHQPVWGHPTSVES